MATLPHSFTANQGLAALELTENLEALASAVTALETLVGGIQAGEFRAGEEEGSTNGSGEYSISFTGLAQPNVVIQPMPPIAPGSVDETTLNWVVDSAGPTGATIIFYDEAGTEIVSDVVRFMWVAGETS